MLTFFPGPHLIRNLRCRAAAKGVPVWFASGHATAFMLSSGILPVKHNPESHPLIQVIWKWGLLEELSHRSSYCRAVGEVFDF